MLRRYFVLWGVPMIAAPQSADATLGRSTNACLVADVGGTNARFAIAQGDSRTQLVELAAPQSRRVEDFESLADAARDYLLTCGTRERPSHAVFAVAGPVQDDRVVFSNSVWSFSTAELARQIGMESLRVINDFAAVAWAVPALRAEDQEAIGEPAAWTTSQAGTCAIVGPGTGLGVASIDRRDGRLDVRASEGGHISFAPRDEDEIYLMRFLKARHGRVSAERLLCGDGLLALYQALCARDALAPIWRRAEQVTEAARDGDPVARAASRAFCGIFGSFAADVALMFCAWDGIYLAGSMLGHVLHGENARHFRERFEEKGRFSSALSRVPTRRIVRADVGKLGAAMYALRG